MMRAWVIGCLLLAATAGGALADPVLKPQVVVDRDMVRLGDLFADLPANVDASIDVVRAPAPGQRITLDASALMTIANSQHIAWKPSGRFDRVTLERAGQIISTQMIRETVVHSLEDYGMPQGAEVTFDNERLQVTAPTDRAATLRTDAVIYDPTKPRFELTLVVGGDGRDGGERVKILGKVYRMVDMPAPVRPIAPLEVIRARDIQMVRVRADQVGPTQINDPDKLVDKSARRVLAAGQPVRVSDISAPILVPKNSLVNVKIISKRLSIVMQGKALEDGAEGEPVRVVNQRSNKIVQGVVNSQGEVVVTTSYSLVSN